MQSNLLEENRATTAHHHPVKDAAKTSRGWDRLGMWISYGCAIHCAIMPIAIGYMALNGSQRTATEALEWTIIAASLSIGLFRLIYSYAREHRQPEPVVYFMIGVGLVLAAKSVFFAAPAHLEQAGMVAGGLMIGTAHFRNRSKCNCCHHH